MSSTKAVERLFKYPPMERQDLNQSQLGSFKFTPVDPVSSVQTLTQSAKRFLDKQLLQKQRLAGVGPFQDSTNALTSHQNMQHGPDPDFFNTYIKPDLGDSRLRLGPAAFRSAVDGASPVRKPHFQQEPVYTERIVRSSMPIDPPHAAIRPPLDVSSNPSTFLSSVDHLNQGPAESASLVETLCMALANEQRAHQATKAAFAQHVTQTVELGDQLKESKQQVASQNITIKNLGAIIKHNTSKQSSAEDKLLNQTEFLEEAEEAALKEFYREHNRLKKFAAEREGQKVNKSPQPSDPLQANRLAEKDTAGEVVVAAACPKTLGDADLYNLDLLQKPITDDSEDSAWRRTLRQHFFIDSSADDGKVPVTPSEKRGTLKNLVDISPESSEGDRVTTELPQRTFTRSGGLTSTQIRLLKGIDSTVHSSEEVVAKYGHKSVPRPSRLSRKLSNRPNLTMEHLAKLDDLHLSGDGAVKSSEDNYGRLTPVSSVFQEDGQSTAAVVSSAAQPKSCLTVKIGSNLEGEPKWIINKSNPIYEDEGDKWRSIDGSGHDFRNRSRFFEHPVRYLPEDAAVNSNSYRTVMVDGIPLGSTMMNVLTIVKGGPLESIQLFPPIGKATSFMTARLVFIYERSAHQMIQYQDANAGQNFEANRFKIQDVTVRCWMPTDPTYPRNDDLENEIHGNECASRIILIHGVDEYLYNQIPYKLRAIKPGCDKHVLEYNYIDDDYISIEFSHIKTAVKAFKALQVDSELWSARFEYEEDYTCASYIKRSVVIG